MTTERAQALIRAANDAATELGTPMAIAVVDSSGHLVAFWRMDGCSFIACDIAIGKAWTSAGTRLPTATFGEFVREDPYFVTAGSVATHGRLMAVGGGAPVREGDAVIGAIGVSGGTADQDQQIADAAIA